ncbi:MAG: iron(III) transport system substrate-binding protein [Janthinobacterium sp.]|jgi:iron(III) transport system substrate-binding protein
MTLLKFGKLAAACASACIATGVAAGTANAQEVNLYSSRHYQTDQALYANFTKQTGIKINRIEAGENELFERIKNEGANSPADVLLTVDAARLGQADQLGLFAKVDSSILKARIPAHLRTPGWYAFSTRARVIVYNKKSVNGDEVQNYEDLANPRLKGKVCVRSGSHPYNLSLGAALLSHLGAQKTSAWANGLVANFARSPRGGDTDQIKAVAAGQCGVALVNSYYVARMLGSDNPEDQKYMQSITLVWPNQAGTGAHINISGAGVLKTAPNPASAVKFLEYLASDDAQRYLADGNNEWPVVPSVKTSNPALAQMGPFKADDMQIGSVASQQAAVQRIYDRAGWQ